MKEEGITEGFYLMYEHHYTKGIFCFSSLLMMQVTIIDNMMKISAKDRYAALYSNNQNAALDGFAALWGISVFRYFGQVTCNLKLMHLLTLLMFWCVYICFYLHCKR